MHRDHSGGVVWTSFSPKGSYLGTAAMDSTAIVYVYHALLSGGCCGFCSLLHPLQNHFEPRAHAVDICALPSLSIPPLPVPAVQLRGLHPGYRVPFVGPRGWSSSHFLRP